MSMLHRNFLHLIHLLKVKGKFFDLLQPKPYLSRLENIARDAT